MSDVVGRLSTGMAARSVARWLSPLAVLLGTGLLAAGHLLDAPQPWTPGVVLVPPVLWLAARARRCVPAVDAALVAFVALAGLGAWLGVGAGWTVPAVVAGLAAWDLERFERRLALAGHVEDASRLAARHLVQLLPVLVIGLTLAMVGAHVSLDLGFLPALLLGVLAIAGLARTVTYLRRDE